MSSPLPLFELPLLRLFVATATAAKALDVLARVKFDELSGSDGSGDSASPSPKRTAGDSPLRVGMIMIVFPLTRYCCRYVSVELNAHCLINNLFTGCVGG